MHSGSFRLLSQRVELNQGVEVGVLRCRIAPTMADIHDTTLFEEPDRDVHLRERQILLPCNELPGSTLAFEGRFLNGVSDCFQGWFRASVAVGTGIAACCRYRTHQVSVLNHKLHVALPNAGDHWNSLGASDRQTWARISRESTLSRTSL